jgi:hypothetical protein
MSADENRPHSNFKGLNSIPGECSNRAKDLGGSSVESHGSCLIVETLSSQGGVEEKTPYVPESLKEKIELKRDMENRLRACMTRVIPLITF